jgi:hypothetical protein
VSRARVSVVIALACVCLAAVACMALVAASAVPAAAEPVVAETAATIGASFSPDRLRARAALTLTVTFSGGELGVPSPVRRAVVRFPRGLSLHIPHLASCTVAQLQARGAQGCPAQSLLGSGHAVAEVHAGTEFEHENATVSAFIGPFQGGDPTIEILGQGYTPLDERAVATGTLLPDRPPYGEKLQLSIPPIPSIPLEPDASVIFFTITVGGAHSEARDANTVVLPSSCPAGGFPFAAAFTYEDGSTAAAAATVPCP